MEVNSSKNNNSTRDASDSKDPYDSWVLGISELFLEVPSSYVRSFCGSLLIYLCVKGTVARDGFLAYLVLGRMHSRELNHFRFV